MKKLCVTVLALIMSLALCLSLTACSSKTVEQLQNEFGAVLEGGKFEEGSVLNFDKVDNASDKAGEIFEMLGDVGVTITDQTKVYIYDISVTKDSKEVRPSGKVKLTVPLPQESSVTGYTVYHIGSDGKAAEVPATYANGKLTFETDGFSYFAFVATSSDVPAPIEFTVIATAGEGGSITDGYANGKKVEAGSSVTLLAVADDGYHFVGWFLGDALVSEDATYTFNVDEDMTLEARFGIDEVPASAEVTLIANAGEGGTITDGYANGVKLEKGSSVTLSAIPDNGYHFVGWLVGETKVSDEMRYTFTINEDTTLVAKFEKDDTSIETYRFMCNVQGNGSIWENDENATETYQYGATLNEETKITLTAKPDTYWQFKGWYQSDGTSLISTDATYTFELTDHTFVCAIFEEKPMNNFIATSTPYEGGYLTENGQTVDFGNGRQVEPGTQITLTAVANAEYNFTGWYSYTADQQEVQISTDATYTFTVNEATTVFAKFEEKVKYNFLATVTPYEGGYLTENGQTVDFENGRMVEPNTQITLTAVANEGYNFTGWYSYTADQQEVQISADATYTFTVNEPTTVFAKFEEKEKHNFYAYCEQPDGGYITENGQIVEFDGERMVNHGTQITLTAVANTGYGFKGWYYYTENQVETLISDKATHTFTVNAPISVYAKFEEKTTYNFLAQCDPNNGGYITENNQTVDFGNGRMVDPDTQITLTAVANDGYVFVGWGTRDDEWNLTIISTNATYTFTVTENTYVQAVFEEKPNGLKLDAHNAGFTYNENGELVTTVYQIGNDIQPNIDHVGVWATYASSNTQNKYLTINEDYTRNLGGLDFTKAGTYTVTYTYKADTSLTATLTVQVVEKPADGSLTEAEWNAAMAYWKAQTNVKVVERIAGRYDDDSGAQIMLYLYNGTAYSEDGYFEGDQASQDYKGKATYYVKEGDKYYRIEWGYRDEECWVKSPASQAEYEGYIASTIFRLPNYVDVENDNVFDYSNFTYDATNKIYKNSAETISFAFTFENNVLTKFVLTEYRESDGTTFTITYTFGDAEVDAPQVSVDSHFTTVVKTGDENNKDGGTINTENGEEYVNGRYGKYYEAGTTFTLTAAAKDGYVFKHWGTSEYNYDTREYEFTVFSTEQEYTVVIGEYELVLYAVFEKVEAEE